MTKVELEKLLAQNKRTITRLQRELGKQKALTEALRFSRGATKHIR